MTNETSIDKTHVVKFVLFLASLLIIYNIIERMFGGNFMSISVPRQLWLRMRIYVRSVICLSSNPITKTVGKQNRPRSKGNDLAVEVFVKNSIRFPPCIIRHSSA